jgi:hypothetical protein
MEESFVQMVEEDLQRIGKWVTRQSEGLHTRLARLRVNASDQTYSVDYLRGARIAVPRTWCCSTMLSLPAAAHIAQSKLMRLGGARVSWTS